MHYYRKKIPGGTSLVELIIAMVLSSVLVLTIGVLLVSGQKAWQNTYNSAYHKIKQDAYALSTAFGSVGRKSNRIDYNLYDIVEGSFILVEPETGSEEVLYADAVEFRYWDVELDAEDSHGLMDVSKTATAYALFYLDDEELKVDYGPFPPGAVPEGSGSKNTDEINTVVLAENISTGEYTVDENDDNIDYGIFSHTTVGGTGLGCVRINAVLEDPESGRSTKVVTAVLMRNVWPR